MKKLRLLALLFLLIVLVAATEDEICHDGECYPRIFVPTEEFQVIREGQEIPGGLHVRMNIQTGEKEAKLYNEEEDDEDSEKIIFDKNMIQIIESKSPSPEPSPDKKRAMQTYVMPPRVWHENSAHTDDEVFEHAFDLLLQTDEYTSGKPISFGIWNLESLAHDREYGIKLMQPDPLKHLLLLARTNVGWQIRQGAARVIGSALWNNPEASKAVEGSRLMLQLLEIIKKEKDSRVKTSLIFALSAAALDRSEGTTKFLEAGGSEFLRHEFEQGDSEIKGKCATFVQDNLISTSHDELSSKELAEWCNVLQKSLIENTAGDAAEKVLECLIAMKQEDKEMCSSPLEFQKWLADVVTGSRPSSEPVLALVKRARHLFGNPKAARKTAWEDASHIRDEL